MSQKHLPGGPRTNGNHADRLMLELTDLENTVGEPGVK
jgi:hypothetical protein